MTKPNKQTSEELHLGADGHNAGHPGVTAESAIVDYNYKVEYLYSYSIYSCSSV